MPLGVYLLYSALQDNSVREGEQVVVRPGKGDGYVQHVAGLRGVIPREVNQRRESVQHAQRPSCGEIFGVIAHRSHPAGGAYLAAAHSAQRLAVEPHVSGHAEYAEEESHGQQFLTAHGKASGSQHRRPGEQYYSQKIVAARRCNTPDRVGQTKAYRRQPKHRSNLSIHIQRETKGGKDAIRTFPPGIISGSYQMKPGKETPPVTFSISAAP